MTYGYDTAGEMTSVAENGTAALATYAYDDLGRRTSLTRGNGVTTSYGYDAASRLASLTNDLAGTAYDLSLTFGYNAVGQITSRTSSNDAYAWTGAVNVDRGYQVNGLNQYTASGAVALGYDGRGNLTSAGSTRYGYTSDNLLATATGITGLAHDQWGGWPAPLGSLHYALSLACPRVGRGRPLSCARSRAISGPESLRPIRRRECTVKAWD